MSLPVQSFLWLLKHMEDSYLCLLILSAMSFLTLKIHFPPYWLYWRHHLPHNFLLDARYCEVEILGCWVSCLTIHILKLCSRMQFIP